MPAISQRGISKMNAKEDKRSMCKIHHTKLGPSSSSARIGPSIGVHDSSLIFVLSGYPNRTVFLALVEYGERIQSVTLRLAMSYWIVKCIT